MSAAALLGLVGYFVLPSVLPVFGMTTLAFPLIAGAAILDTLGSVAERRDGLLRAAGACIALWPLLGVLSDLKATYSGWRDGGWPVPRAVWEALKQLSQYPKADKIAMLITGGIGIVSLILAIGLPITGTLNPRIRRNRQSRSGPWKAGWMILPRPLGQQPTELRWAINHPRSLRTAHKGDFGNSLHQPPIGLCSASSEAQAGGPIFFPFSAICPTGLDLAFRI